MPLVHRKVVPYKLSNKKLQLGQTDSEFIAVNNGTLVAVLKQLASLVSIAGEIFSGLSTLTGEVCGKIQIMKLRLEEIEVKTELFDPKLIPVPEGNFNWHEDSVGPEKVRLRSVQNLDSKFFLDSSRPDILVKLYLEAGKYVPRVPPRNPLLPQASENVLRTNGVQTSGEGHLVKLRDEKQKDGTVVVAKKFPGEVLVSVDVTGSIFDRMKANRRSLLVYTKKIRQKKKRRNTICGSVPNKECGVQTSLHSVTVEVENHKSRKYAGDSGHWSSSTESRGDDLQSPWEQQSNSSDFFYDEDEDRTLTPQLEKFTDGMVSDSDSVDTEGYFTSFRNECGFPRIKKTKSIEDHEKKEGDYELFGKGSTSTTASSCGTVIMRKKLELPDSDSSQSKMANDGELEERVKRKSLIERIPSLVMVTPSPSCSSASPIPGDMSSNESDDVQTNREEEELLEELKRMSSYSSDTLSTSHSSHGSTETLRDDLIFPNLPQPDVIADVYQVTVKAPLTKLDSGQEYCSLESPFLLGSSIEEQAHDSSQIMFKMETTPVQKSRGARVVLDANGEIIFSSETLRRKRRHKVSFDPGQAVKPLLYDTLPRDRESVYDRIRKETTGEGSDKLYECIEQIRRHNLKESEAASDLLCHENYSNPLQIIETSSPASSRLLLETDLDSAIPPVMPELKTLPKIKDCLKRNESYRKATDEPRVQTDDNDKLPSDCLTSPRESRWKQRDRDIPEEDPTFVQQVFSFSQLSKLGTPSPSTVSKIPVSPEDRPSFLRSRESPPTMEEISKQIYHFRKKFNIQPITLSRKLCSSQFPPTPPPRQTSAILRETSLTTPLQAEKTNLLPRQILESNASTARVNATQSPAVQRNFVSVLKDSTVQPSPSITPKSVSFSSVTMDTAGVSLRPKTSLSHFKRLLNATASKGNLGKKSSVSAMEVLRPRQFGGQETRL